MQGLAFVDRLDSAQTKLDAIWAIHRVRKILAAVTHINEALEVCIFDFLRMIGFETVCAYREGMPGPLVECSDVGQFFRNFGAKLGASRPGSFFCRAVMLAQQHSTQRDSGEAESMSNIGVLPVKAVEVLRSGHAVSPIPTVSTVSSRHVGWNGIVLEAFCDVPACTIPEHEHPTHFLNLLTSGRIRSQWTIGGRTRSAEHGPGTVYILPAGTRDRMAWSGPTNRIVLVMEPRFLARALDETAHLADVELTAHWTLQDRHIASVMRALHADLEDGSPAGPLYGESLGVALAHYLIRRYAVRTSREPEYRGGISAVRLNRVLDFIRQNCTKEMRLWELGQLAGMSPHYFCQLFKQSTGLSPHQFVLCQRIERAKEYLRNSDVSIGAAAEAAGFMDQSHFTKVFRRIVGVAPKQFREDTA